LKSGSALVREYNTHHERATGERLRPPEKIRNLHHSEDEQCLS
jgi:hypothetical protein